MPSPELNAPYQAESETSSGDAKPSGGWDEKFVDLSEMSPDQRRDWLKGDPAKSEKWSSSSLSGFERPDAPVDEPESETTVQGDVKTVSKERKADPEGSEDSAAVEPEAERHSKHQKNYTELPSRLVREIADEFQELHQAGGQIPVTAELGEFLRHTLGDSGNPGRIYKHLTKNPALVQAMHSMSGQSILGIIQDLDSKFSTPEKRVTKAPPPAREVGGRGSSSGDDEKTAIAQGDFRSFRRAANSKAVARAKNR